MPLYRGAVSQKGAGRVQGAEVFQRWYPKAVAQVLRQALASNAAPLVAAVLVAVGAWPLPQHHGEPRASDKADDS